MKKVAIGCLLVLLCSAAMASAQEAKARLIRIEHAWLRATPKGAPVIGGYATVKNEGTLPDRIVGAQIPVASRAEIHSMTMNGGVMDMRRLGDGLPVAPGATVTLTPGGYHLMFLKPSKQIKEGQELQGTILFEKAGAVPVTFAVGGIGAKTAPADKAMGGMPGMDMKP